MNNATTPADLFPPFHTCAPLVRVVVVNENILGHIYPDQPADLVFLVAVSILRGYSGDFHALYTRIGTRDVVRPATPADYAAFRVQYTPNEGPRKCLYGYAYDVDLH